MPRPRPTARTGFTCAVATQAGPFCCKKLCICKSDLVEGVNVDPDGGTIIPFSCDPNAEPDPDLPERQVVHERVLDVLDDARR